MAKVASLSNSSTTSPKHISSHMPIPVINEKIPYHKEHSTQIADDARLVGRGAPTVDDGEEELDRLLEELEADDPEAEVEDHITDCGQARQVPEELLQTDIKIGLTEVEANARRKKYGLNQMKQEKKNLILKFLRYFVGPIQFVMEVSHHLMHLLT